MNKRTNGNGDMQQEKADTILYILKSSAASAITTTTKSTSGSSY